MSKTPIQDFFPVLPEYMDWEQWNNELVIYYGQRNIERSPEDSWQAGALNIVQSPLFSRYPVPDPATFDSWQDWAYEFTNIVNGKKY